MESHQSLKVSNLLLVLSYVALHGSGIEKDHCRIDVCENGKSVYLKPVAEKCFLNGLCVDRDRKLTQGDIIKFGDSLKFRFNNPKEAAMLLEKRRSGNFSAEVSEDYLKVMLLCMLKFSF